MRSKAVRIILNGLPYETKVEVYNSLNSWEWHPALGEKPIWWGAPDPKMRKHSALIGPIMHEIEKTVARKDILEHWHICHLGRSKEEFEQWWRWAYAPREGQAQREWLRCDKACLIILLILLAIITICCAIIYFCLP